MTAGATLGRRIVRSRAAARLLAGCGIDPQRYWLLFDLFATLGARQELAMLGTDCSLRTMALFWCLFSSLGSVAGILIGASPTGYLLAFVVLTAFVLGALLVSEVAENLVNPAVELTLAHQPVNAATWSAAKLTHLLKVVVYVVGGMNAVPSVGGAFLVHTGALPAPVYPAVHLLVALGAGVVVALFCCSLFGWLVRLVPIRRLKAVAAVVQGLPLVALWGFQISGGSAALGELRAWAAAVELPSGLRVAVEAAPGGLRGLLGVAGAAVAAGAVGFGLRALSSDHLLRVAGLMRSGVRTSRRRRRRRGAGPWVARLAGGQAARAGFEYVRALIVRDWQFLRSAGSAAGPFMAGTLALLVAAGLVPSPFAPGGVFHPAHFLPHTLGWASLMGCRVLAFGNDHKGTWTFAAAPDSSLRPFAAGVHAALWLLLVAAPHVVWLLCLAWFWGLPQAAGFVAYSAAVVSLYLAGSLWLVQGLPFGRPPSPARAGLPIGLVIALFIPTAVAVGIQLVLFRLATAVAVATLVAAAGAYLLARTTIPALESRIRSSLRRDPPGSMFRFAYADEE